MRARYLAQLGDHEAAAHVLSEFFERVKAREHPLRMLRDKAADGVPIGLDIRHAADGVAELFFTLGQSFDQNAKKQRFYYQIVRMLRPDWSLIHVVMGEMRTNLLSTKFPHYGRVADSDPWGSHARMKQGLALREAGAGNKAETWLKAAVHLYPDSEDALVELAYTQLKLKKQKAVIETTDRLFDLGKKLRRGPHPRGLHIRAIAHHELDEWPEARKRFEELIALDPDNSQALNYFGYVLVEKQEDLGLARKLLERAYELRPKDWHIAHSVGALNYAEGNFEEAVRLFKLTLKARPNEPKTLEDLGNAYWKLNNLEDAETYWALAKSHLPESKEKAISRIVRKLDRLESVRRAPAQ